MLGTPYDLGYAITCWSEHAAYALLLSPALFFLTWTISSRGWLDRRTFTSLCLAGFALGATSHWLGDYLGLGF